jgi:hypothetical protein
VLRYLGFDNGKLIMLCDSQMTPIKRERLFKQWLHWVSQPQRVSLLHVLAPKHLVSISLNCAIESFGNDLKAQILILSAYQ